MGIVYLVIAVILILVFVCGIGLISEGDWRMSGGIFTGNMVNEDKGFSHVLIGLGICAADAGIFYVLVKFPVIETISGFFAFIGQHLP